MSLEISAKDAATRLTHSHPPLLLDCRRPDEVATARISGALHVPMDELPRRLNELPPEREIIVYCHHGARSLRVTHWLREQGFPRVVSMAGGIEAWSREVDPSVPLY